MNDEENVLRNAVGVIEAVRCAHCNRLHPANAKTYVVLDGVILASGGGGLLGNSERRPMAFCDRCMVAAVWQALQGQVKDPGPPPSQTRTCFLDPV